MRKFHLTNHAKTDTFNLNGEGIYVVDETAGLGNKKNTSILDTRVRKYVIESFNDFQNISLRLVFGTNNTNAYSKYNSLITFIRKYQNDLSLGYEANGRLLYTDVQLIDAPKSNKTPFGVFEETFTFNRLTPFYIHRTKEGRFITIENTYYENILPKITLKDAVRSKPEINAEGINLFYHYNYPSGTQILDGVEVNYNKDDNVFTFNGSGIYHIDFITPPELSGQTLKITVKLYQDIPNAQTTLDFYNGNNLEDYMELDIQGEQTMVVQASSVDNSKLRLYFYGNYTDVKLSIQVAIAEAEDTSFEPYTNPTAINQIKLKTNLTLNDVFVIDTEFLKITRNGKNAYNELDKTKSSVLPIPTGKYLISSEQDIIVEWKEWVVD
ncbi:MAG: hypothetical protein WC008_05560 [Bacilli bacterium]